MYIPSITPSTLLTSTLALHPRATDPLPGSCTASNFPTEADYTLGYRQFCATYLAPKPDGTPHNILESEPLVATLDLKDDAGTVVKWIYKIAVDDDTKPVAAILPVDQGGCEEKFREFLEQPGGGMLGKGYCVVDGTGGDGFGGRGGVDGMSGQGRVLVLGGKVFGEYGGVAGRARLVFETRRREG
tara:strand:+ start:11063 stop:11620 length:558 start_codon:yes stop_codon:yes gene_type:complete